MQLGKPSIMDHLYVIDPNGVNNLTHIKPMIIIFFDVLAPKNQVILYHGEIGKIIPNTHSYTYSHLKILI